MQVAQEQNHAGNVNPQAQNNPAGNVNAQAQNPVKISFPYDSKRDAGFVGILKESGDKAYMNSLLQILFHIPYFRRAVCQIPISENTPDVVLALHDMFRCLQYSDTSVSKMRLNTSASLLKDEVKFLCEELERSMKGTSEEGTVQKLFVGHCKYVDDTSAKPFFSLKLDVENCNDVYASFDSFVQGDNTNHGAKAAGVLFTELPPILQLHLARFKDDKDTTKKLNAQYKYPLELDLDRDDGKYLAIEADRRIKNLYTLQSVIVHNGDGKYFALIQPQLSDLWFKFEDEVVKRVDVRRALDEQYGGDEEDPPFSFTKASNAITLQYVRNSEKARIYSLDIPDAHLRVGLNKADGFVTIEIAREEDEQFGKVLRFRISKLCSFEKFQEALGEYYGVEVQRLRFYTSKDKTSSIIQPRSYPNTVEQLVGDSEGVVIFLRFNKTPGLAGVSDFCTLLDPDTDIEDIGKEPKHINKSSKVSKNSAKVTKKSIKNSDK